LTAAELRAANRVFAWMDRLEAPDESVLASHPEAVSWFRKEATEYIRQAERLSTILDAHGQSVTRREVEDPGPIVYEDSVQVLALSRLVP